MSGVLLPNLFLVGAPRSGTTAMYNYLGQHPDVFMPWVKEPHFFSADIRAPWNIQSEADYGALFTDSGEARLAGDGSTHYLQSKVAAAAIKSFNANARIVAMLRNPVDMTYSLHGHLVHTGTEPLTSFADALRQEPERLELLRPLRRGYPALGACYRDCADYAPQLSRYMSEFGRDAIKVVTYDDFAADPIAAAKEIYSFIGVDDAFQPRAEVLNAQRVARGPLVRKLLPRSISARRRIRSVLPPGVRRRLRDLTSKERPRDPLAPEMRLELCRAFAPGVERLSALLSRDLTSWCEE